MNFFREDLRGVRAFAFDMDGVMSPNELILHPGGDMMRSVNTRDGYAIKKALSEGFRVAVITGGSSESIRKRFADLGEVEVFLRSSDKVRDLRICIEKWGIGMDQVLYMGDDIPDLEVMKMVGLPTCPSDATAEILAVSRYISTYPGGHGCVRDVIEQVLRSQGYWNFS
jgi:3-deoxy-D-manno-octulosonate 8-phosphate phosphatase (KDO 8-P phosphatase)